jgi:hypothetical protein
VFGGYQFASCENVPSRLVSDFLYRSRSRLEITPVASVALIDVSNLRGQHLQDMPVPLYKPKATWRAGRGELWVVGRPELSLSSDQSLTVLVYVLDIRRNFWQEVGLFTSTHYKSQPTFCGPNVLLFVDDEVAFELDGCSVVKEFLLPIRINSEFLHISKSILIGNCIVSLSSGAQCRREYNSAVSTNNHLLLWKIPHLPLTGRSLP